MTVISGGAGKNPTYQRPPRDDTEPPSGPPDPTELISNPGGIVTSIDLTSLLGGVEGGRSSEDDDSSGKTLKQSGGKQSNKGSLSSSPKVQGSRGRRGGSSRPRATRSVGLNSVRGSADRLRGTGLGEAQATAGMNTQSTLDNLKAIIGAGAEALGLPLRDPSEYINDLMQALQQGPFEYGLPPQGSPEMTQQQQQAVQQQLGNITGGAGVNPTQPPMSPRGVPLPVILKTGGPPQEQMANVPGVGPVQPSALRAAADRLTALAGDYGMVPGLSPQQTALNIPWTTLGFEDHNQGAQWAQQFFDDYGIWPWEGSGSEEENLGRNLAAYYTYAADLGGNPYGNGPYYDPYYNNQYQTNPYASADWYNWIDWGRDGGGGGAYGYPPYNYPWYYTDMQSGV